MKKSNVQISKLQTVVSDVSASEPVVVNLDFGCLDFGFFAL